MPQVIDALPTPAKNVIYWDVGCHGFGVKMTPKGRKVSSPCIERQEPARSCANIPSRRVAG